MKASVYMGPKTVEVREMPEPVAAAGEIKLKVKFCGVCGSDTGIFLGTHPRAKAPLILGHEFVGEVCTEGKKFHRGDLVIPFPLMPCGHCRACRTGNEHVCNNFKILGTDAAGGMAQYAVVKEDNCFLVPEGVSAEVAATAEPLAVIVRAIHQSGFKALDTVAVIGAGPIGMIAGLMLKRLGAAKVFISDINQNRLEKAREYGLIPVNSKTGDLEKIAKELTGGEGVDVLFECSGSEFASLQMTKVLRVSGTICMVAVHKAQHKVDLRDINFKEQTLIGTRVYTKEEFRQAVEYLPEAEDLLKKVITHVVPLKDAPSVFGMIADENQGTLKVLVDCQNI